MARNEKEVNICFDSIKTYIDHYSGICATEQVSLARLSNMKGVLTLNVADTRKTILGQRKELESILSKCSNLSDEQIKIVKNHNDGVDTFLENLPNLYNDGNVHISFGGEFYRIDEDGKLAAPKAQRHDLENPQKQNSLGQDSVSTTPALEPPEI